MKKSLMDKMHSGSSYAFPLRLPAEKLAAVYSSAEEAFYSHDYLYAARFAVDNPEIRGCALLMLGNRVGGARVLDQHNVKTGRSCFYRAAAAWMDGDKAEMQRWIDEGRSFGGADIEFDRFALLAERTKFRVVVWNGCGEQEVPTQLRDLPDIEAVAAKDLARDDAVDLILTYDMSYDGSLVSTYAPVVAIVNDHEWHYDRLDRLLAHVDLVSCGASSEAIEIAQASGKDYMVSPQFPFGMPVELGGMTERFSDKASRTTDLVFTGGIAHDFYRDKRQRLLSLALELGSDLSVRFYDWSFPENVYRGLMQTSRFLVSSVRYCNYVSWREVEALALGVLNLVPQESCAPFIFSERFPCFQTYSNDNCISDIETHLRNYNKIVSELLPRIEQLEAEAVGLFSDQKVLLLRGLRRLLFVCHMDRIVQGRPKVVANSHAPASGQLLRELLEEAEPLTDPVLLLRGVEAGIEQYPESLPLRYSRALLLHSLGRFAGAGLDFHAIVSNEYIVKDDDPFPYQWDALHGLYWIIDARIRAKCAGKLEPLVPETAVWRSFAFSYLADYALKNVSYLIQDREAIHAQLKQAAALAERAVNAFPYNDTAWRSYLRAAYGLYSTGETEWGERFLEFFAVLRGMDARAYNDFSGMLADILQDREDVDGKVRMFLGRFYMARSKFYLYPEILPLLMKYNLRHGALSKL